MSSELNLILEQSPAKLKPSLSTSGKVLIALTGGIGVAISAICIPFVAPAFRRICLPYVPATTCQIENVMSVLKSKAKGKLLDIGSGDGRIVIASASEQGHMSHGVELNSVLVQYSRLAALRAGVFGKTAFYKKDLWKFDVSSYNYIVIFGVEQMMAELEKKLVAEACENSTIIACRFPLPNLNPIKMIGSGVDTVWVYEKKR